MKPEITYRQEGDYLIPNIQLKETEGTIGKYGMLRKEYLREHKQAQFDWLVLTGRLDAEMMKIDEEVRIKVEHLEKELLKKDPAPEKMKDNLAWARHMNRIHAQAEEIVLAELVYR